MDCDSSVERATSKRFPETFDSIESVKRHGCFGIGATTPPHPTDLTSRNGASNARR
jgi:hypothetical protein